ncbi:hypothetical protein BpJC4_11650 [Weizmannia acidilactici]|nr:hypothetical protein BpJC4_11650 [Weizmannia acidilactici]
MTEFGAQRIAKTGGQFRRFFDKMTSGRCKRCLKPDGTIPPLFRAQNEQNVQKGFYIPNVANAYNTSLFE